MIILLLLYTFIGAFFYCAAVHLVRKWEIWNSLFVIIIGGPIVWAFLILAFIYFIVVYGFYKLKNKYE